MTLASDAFDAYLLITGPGLTDVLADDDGAGNFNSLITLTFPTTGSYTVVASTVDEGSFGPYTLSVTRPVELNELDTGGRTVTVGGAVAGRLTSDDPLIGGGRHGQAWALEGAARESYTIDLASNEFDSYLLLVGPGIEEPLADDDGGGGLDSRLHISLPADGLYRVIVTSVDAGATGAFRLRVTPE